MDQSLQFQQRLTRNRSRGLIAGVCAGLSVYFGINLTFIRLLFVLLGLSQGIGFVFYLILFVVIPAAPVAVTPPDHFLESSGRSRRSLFTYIAAIVSSIAALVGFLSNVTQVMNWLASL